jgi:hypothetical protein
MNDKQLQKIIDGVKASKRTENIESLLYQLIDTAGDNGQQVIDVQDLRAIVDEL